MNNLPANPLPPIGPFGKYVILAIIVLCIYLGYLPNTFEEYKGDLYTVGPYRAKQILMWVALSWVPFMLWDGYTVLKRDKK